MPVGLPLILGGELKEQLFAKGGCDKLHAHGQAIAETTRQGYGWQPGEAGGHRVQILLVHGDVVIGELVFFESRGWRSGCEQHINLGKSLLKVFANQSTYFLSFQVVRVEISYR